MVGSLPNIYTHYNDYSGKIYTSAKLYFNKRINSIDSVLISPARLYN